jgi:hypothetical protein
MGHSICTSDDKNDQIASIVEPTTSKLCSEENREVNFNNETDVQEEESNPLNNFISKHHN